MTATGSIGLIAVFIVDALNLYYISLLGVEELAAAIGFASTLLFFTMSVTIGFTIACGALVSRSLGRGERDRAAALAGASMVFMGVTTTLLTIAAWPFLGVLVGLMGARGETLALATIFMQIVVPSTPILALAMCTTGILRGVGDARRSMYVTLAGALAAAILDPIFIFLLDLGLEGAAIANVLSRFAMLAVGLHGAWRVHKMLKLPNAAVLAASAPPFFAIGLPALATQVATPVGNTYVTVEVAAFGDQAVAGWAIIGRIIPVAFGVIFALSGAAGPILGQNYGAGRHERLLSTMRDSLLVTAVYVMAMWALLALFAEQIASLFGAVGLSREMIVFFCHFAAGSFLFNGAIFVASAAFNNLGYPTYSTLFNWGRSTLGVIPFVWIGAGMYGAIGVVAGWGLGAVLFGILSVIVCFRVLRQIGKAPPDARGMPVSPDPAPAKVAATPQPE